MSSNGLKQMHESTNLYLIDRALVKYADGKDQKKLAHLNPRWLSGKPNGFSEPEMQELRESIRRDGLIHPISVAKINGKLVVVAGERRKRCIDKLCQDGVKCFNPVTKTMVPAAELYEHIECRFLENCDDEKALRLAIAENETARDIGDGSRAELVRYLKDHGNTDEQIIDITGKTQAWLNKMNMILGLDKDTYTAFVQGKIAQSVALELAEMSEKDRKACLQKAIEFATVRSAALKKSLEAASIEEQDALAELDAANLDNNDEAKEHAESRIKQAELRKNRISKKKTMANSSDLEKAKKKLGKAGGILSSPKIIACWYKHQPGGVRDLCLNAEMGQKEIEGLSVPLLRWTKYLIEEGIMKGEKDICKLLRTYMKNCKEV